MSLDEAIQHKKEYRKPYRKAKAYSCSCRNHGSCDYCRNNRLIQQTRELERIKSEIKENNLREQ